MFALLMKPNSILAAAHAAASAAVEGNSGGVRGGSVHHVNLGVGCHLACMHG